MSIDLRARPTQALPPNSCFPSLEDSSAFFEAGRVGYSVTRSGCRFDGIALDTETWAVNALEVEYVKSSYFDDESKFPKGSVTFDHALIMRDVAHVWTGLPDVVNEPPQLGDISALPA
jgi:hypothetical protein